MNDFLSSFENELQRLQKHIVITSLETSQSTISQKTGEDIPQTIINGPKPSIEIREDGSVSKISVSQSLISKFFFKGELRDYCPMKVYHTRILKDVEEIPSEAMINGNFFETLCLGSSAYGKTLSIPAGRGGKKSITQERLEEQALNFKLVCEQHGIIINQTDSPGAPKNVQKSFSVNVEIDQFEEQEMGIAINLVTDILSPISFGQVDYPMAVIDLKLTWDRNSTYGEYCWGAPEYMDHIQAYLYGFILSFPFFYLVFDYNSKDRGFKIVPVNTNLQHPDPSKREEAMRRYRETIEIIKKTVQIILNHHHHGWYTNPNRNNCKNCPMVDCIDRNKNQEV